MNDIKREFLAFALLFIPVSLLLISGLIWDLGINMGKFTFPIGLVVALVMNIFVLKEKHIEWSSLLILMFGIIVVSVLCYFIKDPAFDSNWYHQPGIYLLSHGWNPIYEHHSMMLVDESSKMWIDHYAKGQETICASIVAFYWKYGGG